MVDKIRVILNAKDDIFRDIEIKENQNLWNLHNAIKDAFNLKGDELSIFNVLDEEGTVIKSIPLEDMTDTEDGEIMSDVYIKEVFENIGDQLHYQYGLIDLWEFYCQLNEQVEEKKVVQYPRTVFRYGNVPLKSPSNTQVSTISTISMDDDEDDDYDDYSDDFMDNIDDIDNYNFD